MSPQLREKRVIVIGAGASGIGASRTLIQSGIKPIILEARDRIGGRMCSKSLTQNLLVGENKQDSHVTVQLGANWIHGLEDANPFYEVAKKLNLNLLTTSSDDEPGNDVILFDEGADDHDGFHESKGGSQPAAFCRITQVEYKEALDRYEWIRDNFESLTPSKSLHLKDCLENVLLASEEFFGPCSDCHKRCFNWFFDRVSIDLAAPLEFAATDSYLEVETTSFAGEALVLGGYFQVLEHLASEYPLDVRFHQIVTHITYHEATPTQDCFVRVECSNGLVYEADSVLVTLPIGVLQTSIHFSPSVPAQISSLCSTLKMGLMNIVWLWYPHCFWPEDCNFLGVAHKDSALVEFGTFLAPPMFDQHGVKQAVLMCQVVGKFAEEIEYLTSQEVAARGTRVLRNIFGVDCVPEAIGCMHSNWMSDPFSRGSWTHIPYKPPTSVDLSVSVVSVSDVLSVVLTDESGDSASSSSPAAGSARSARSTSFSFDSTVSSSSSSDEGSSECDDFDIRPCESSSEDDDSDSENEGAERLICTDAKNKIKRVAFDDEKMTLEEHSAPLAPITTIDSCVFYSGEASDAEHRGTAHSAYMSGIEEAQKMVMYLSLVTR